MVSDRYAKELIEELEAHGRWSDGTNYVSFASLWVPAIFAHQEFSKLYHTSLSFFVTIKQAHLKLSIYKFLIGH